MKRIVKCDSFLFRINNKMQIKKNNNIKRDIQILNIEK